ncbi:MAG: glycosyltransferase [Paracoccaceae bacterium]
MLAVLSLIIPASNEAGWIGACLTAVAASDPMPNGLQVIVVANGCRDGTATVARGFAGRLPGLQVLELAVGSKPGALNAGDAVATGEVRAYLDADCRISPGVLAGLAQALARPQPGYAGATPVVPRARSWVTRAYARFWQRLPFARAVAPGYGLYAVNAAGRARWGAFPDLISDDTYVRLHFRPDQRIQIPATYLWPMVEGFAALVRVRRRQDTGVRQLMTEMPDLMQQEGKEPLGAAGLVRLALRDPLGFSVYAAVSLAVRLRRGGAGFTRGR